MLVKASVPIESVIAQQCHLEGLSASEEIVEQALEKFRERVLIIIDGSNDDTSEANKNHLFLRDMPDFSKVSVLVVIIVSGIGQFREAAEFHADHRHESAERKL